MASSSPVEIGPEVLATLATKADLAPLVTREELNAAIAPLATRAELEAMRTELRAEIREEGERTRRHFDVVAERLESSISVIAEGNAYLDAKINGVRRELKADVDALDQRVTRLETRRRPR